jgi:hypothetical protein
MMKKAQIGPEWYKMIKNDQPVVPNDQNDQNGLGWSRVVQNDKK